MNKVNLLAAIAVSIHALCEEGDSKISRQRFSLMVSIHALCEEGDCEGFNVYAGGK